LKIIPNAIRRMGLPDQPAEATEEEQTRPQRRGHLRSQYKGEVKTALCRDVQLHEDILLAVAEQFWSGVRKHRFPADSTPGLIVRIAQRTARRIATKRAKEMLDEVASRKGESVFDHVPTNQSGAPELALDDLRDWRRVVPHFRRLDLEERRILIAKIDRTVDKNAYDELAAELNITVGALRTRAHRICRRLREKVEEERQREEGQNGRAKGAKRSA